MKNIIAFLKKIFSREKSKIIIANSVQKIDSNNYIGSINFRLTPNAEIDIEFNHQDITNSSVEEISSLAESYANLIVLINNGLLKKQLLDVIKIYKKENMNNDKNTLLLDNVLFFNQLLQEELKTIKKETGPLIKPSLVFKNSG